jgi:hypothetical protein
MGRWQEAPGKRKVPWNFWGAKKKRKTHVAQREAREQKSCDAMNGTMMILARA